jgi:Uncharacterized protein conserved in bacteria
MNGFKKVDIVRGRIKFITMSLLGIILFLVPIPVVQDGKQQTTLPIAFLAGLLKDWLGGIMPILIVTIITVSGILTILCSTIYKNKLNPQGLMSSAFNVKIGWLVLRVLAVFFSWLTFLHIGPEMIKSEDTGGLVFSSLLLLL